MYNYMELVVLLVSLLTEKSAHNLSQGTENYCLIFIVSIAVAI